MLFAAIALLAITLPAHAEEPFTLPAADVSLTEEVVPAWLRTPEHPDALLDLNSLRAAYPGQITKVEKRPEGIFVILADGSAILYDDGVVKTPEQAIEGEADLQDSLAQPYPLGPVEKSIAAWADPGRSRSEPFLKALFGADKKAVDDTAEAIDFCGRRIRFSGRQNANLQLGKVAQALAVEIEKDPKLKPYVTSLGGTINWRTIAGSKRLSAHSWGAAIDLNSELGAYWKWMPKADLANFPRHRFPPIIIEIFESHGFIWGGKWHHFDLMHFEYRPELIEKAKRK